MKMKVRRAEERGQADHGWLKSAHTFSFADYRDPAHMGFRALRVINDDRVAPGRGFGRHPHRDMEIVSYVLDGELRHQDSMGNGSVISRGDVQRMSAGTGVSHSEENASGLEPVHFLQIWILPDATGNAPGYEQKHFTDADKANRLRLVASPDGRDGSVSLHQDVSLYASIIDQVNPIPFELAVGRHAWIHVAEGELEVSGTKLKAGDAVSTSDAGTLMLSSPSKGHVLVFDLA